MPTAQASLRAVSPWRNGALEPVTGIRQHTAEAHTGRHHAIDLSERDLRLGPCGSIFDRNARPLQPHRIARPALGNEEAQCDHHRHFAARERQRHQRLAVGGLAQADAYCGATPTERSPFFGIAVSSITSTASLPPTSRSA